MKQNFILFKKNFVLTKTWLILILIVFPVYPFQISWTKIIELCILMMLLHRKVLGKKPPIFMQMLIEACSAPGSRIVDFIIGPCINVYKLVFSFFSSSNFFAIIFSNIYHIFYIIFLRSFSKVCLLHVLHFICVEHGDIISWSLRTSLYSMIFLNHCWQAHLHLMQTWETLRMTMSIMRISSLMNFVRKLVNNLF